MSRRSVHFELSDISYVLTNNLVDLIEIKVGL